MKKYLSLAIYTLISYGVSAAVNLHVSLPDSQGYQDLQRATQGQSEITSNSTDVVSLTQLINQYLWIAVGVVAMAVFVV